MPTYALKLVGLPGSTNEDGVMEACGGTCTQVWVARAEGGACSGLAFAEFASEEDMLAASSHLAGMGVRSELVNGVRRGRAVYVGASSRKL